MTRSQSDRLFPFNPEPQRLNRPTRKPKKSVLPMANPNDLNGGEVQEGIEPPRRDPPRTMLEFSRPNMEGADSSIQRPRVMANNFEIRPHIIQMVQLHVQFDGLLDEDPNAHLQQFLEICDTFKINGASEDAIRLRMFPFSLRGAAKKWLSSLPKQSITSWQQLAENFLRKYFPPSRSAKLRADITSFQQMEGETLYEAFERWKELLSKCAHHGLPEWTQVQTFYNGLDYGTRQLIDAAAGGSLNYKSPEECLNLFEEMSANHYQWTNSRAKKDRPAGIHQLDPVTTLASQMASLARKVDKLATDKAQVQMVDDCYSQDTGGVSTETADFIGNYGQNPKNNPYSNTYNPGWRNHPNFRWSNNTGNPNFSNPPPSFQKAGPGTAQGKTSLEDMISQFIKATEKRQDSMEATLRNHAAAIQNLETQLGQISKLLSERSPGTLPANTEANPRDLGKAV